MLQKNVGRRSEAEDLPPFYNEIHKILGAKHKIYPQHVEDTFESVESIDTHNNENETPSNHIDENTVDLRPHQHLMQMYQIGLD
ncbi:unnamed protein product [Callosobruchus maculatus]|uniref:Uncharacterized protein n=1 Tax=Callosobruchus maculatus TaxID=64391 RepID=A0A653BWQ7_CALMS|nr:unnamed protein product [Callosobruchus maculatus]